MNIGLQRNRPALTISPIVCHIAFQSEYKFHPSVQGSGCFVAIWRHRPVFSVSNGGHSIKRKQVALGKES